MAEFFETLMLVCFGLSWQISVVKSYKSCTAQGKSLMFELAIFVGYICGICSKFMAGNINYVLVLYIINLVMVSTDILLYVRNRKLDMDGAAQENFA